MNTDLYINGFASISALGETASKIWNSYLNSKANFNHLKFQNQTYPVSSVKETIKNKIADLKLENKSYKHLDKSVLLGILAARNLTHQLRSIKAFSLDDTGVNLGSSRGATGLFEEHYKNFLNKGKVASRTSPTTTLGNLSSWVAQDIGTQGAVISHSITCSTALHGILNAAAWLKSGMAKQFIVGGTEAPLTAFTIAQLEALKLYSTINEDLACQSLNYSKKTNSLVLGEAACVFALSIQAENAIAKISGMGYANEAIKHSIAISTDAKCFQNSMKMALKQANLNHVDTIVMHAPGTIKGDVAELKAIEKTFKTMPFLTTNKWKIGHTYAASGAMSLELAILMLQHQECIQNPFYNNAKTPNSLNHIMVNAVGFGGNAVSLIVSKL